MKQPLDRPPAGEAAALRRSYRARRFRITLAAVLGLTGCASTAIEQNYRELRQQTQQQLGAELKWLTTDDARRQASSEVEALLAQPLGAEAAVQLALAYSPALQAALYEGAADSAAATQAARLPNPVFAFERMLRSEGGVRELEFTRSLSFSLLDLLMLPSRLRQADEQQLNTRLRLASQVVQAAVETRRAWVDAVAAQQALQYVQQVKAAADASAELARRMQAVGNFSKLQRAREQAFAADAVAQLARATQAAHSRREGLVRALGLDAQQAAKLRLPERLPELPPQARGEAEVARIGMSQRLDLRMARANLERVAREQGLTRVTSVVDGLELAVADQRETGRAAQRGYELSLPLPLFDFGDAARAGAEARYRAALNRTAQLGVAASSQLRDNYGAYRTAYELARHYRDEIVPLRKHIAEENLLRYNGMLIGVFELLADAREQINSVVLAIEAQRDFWLADAALQATLLGPPMAATPVAADGGATASASASAGH